MTVALTRTVLELLQRVEVILAGLESFGIAANPEKTRVGMTEVDYAGHLVDYSGLPLTEEKRDRALDLRLPSSAKHTKALLGLASQLRGHVSSYGAVVAPLLAMTPTYKKSSNTPLQWTKELKDQLNLVQQAVSSCQKLFFVDDTSPVPLHTDASNCGTGAYLLQVVEGKPHPTRLTHQPHTKQVRAQLEHMQERSLCYLLSSSRARTSSTRQEVPPTDRLQRPSFYKHRQVTKSGEVESSFTGTVPACRACA